MELLCFEELTKQQSQYVNTIFGTSKRLADLIINILKLSKLEKQTIVPVMETYDLCEQLAECALNYESAWEKQGLEFDADMEDHVEISADPALMELVWNNLFSNAVKFTELGGRILLTEMSDEETIRVSVQDSGCGMVEETKKHIFEKFYQGDTSHAMAGNGLGLALALRVLQSAVIEDREESRMGNILSYLKWRGDLDFTERSFCDADNLVLSSLVYLDFKGIITENQDGITVREASEIYFRMKEEGKRRDRLDDQILYVMAESKRYGDAVLRGYVEKQESLEEIQFAAMQIALDDGTYYLAFRGTDESIVGWKEDFSISYKVVPVQQMTVEYLEKRVEKKDRFIVWEVIPKAEIWRSMRQ